LITTAFSKEVPPRNTSVLVTLGADELGDGAVFLDDVQAKREKRRIKMQC